MAHQLRDFDKLIDHSNDPIENLQMSQLEKKATNKAVEIIT